MAGYTITDQLSLFREKAEYIEADITILQFNDNDIYDLFYFKRNQFDRKRTIWNPSPQESILIQNLKKNKHQQLASD